MSARNVYRGSALAAVLTAAGMVSWSIGAVSAKDKPTEKPADKPSAKATAALPEKTVQPDGRELFTREWLPKDSRAHGGDGLGPVFNDTSCVACHNQGGAGGAGPASKNVDIVTAFANGFVVQHHQQAVSNSVPEAMFRALFGGFGDPGMQPVAGQPGPQPLAAPKLDKKQLVKKEREELAKIHPGFLSARSVVLHKASTDEKYAPWRGQMQGQGHLFGNHSFGSSGEPVAMSVEFATASPQVVSSEAVDVAVAAAPSVKTALPVANPDVDPALPSVAPPSAAPSVDAPPSVTPTADRPPSDVPSADVIEASVTGANAAVADGATISQLMPMTPSASLAHQIIQQHRNQLQQFRSPTQGTQAQVGNFTFLGSQRNPTALFGAGAIDAIPEAVIRENAARKHKDFPEIAGRVSKLKDGRIGRFGWKNQTASLQDFAVTACAVELGLDVPGHAQAGVPHDSKYKSSGHDMNQTEVDALVKYLRDLPAPAQAKPMNKQQGEYLAGGEKHFASVGCTACHTKDLGPAKGVYSDLLVHDMGQDLGDTGAYGIFIPNSPEEGAEEPLPSLASNQPRGNGKPTAAELEKTIGALRQEWRTPPLWGVRDSGPYLHDGRADTLEQAIALHGGTAARSAQKFFELKREEQLQVLSFLKSLSAPEPQLAGK